MGCKTDERPSRSCLLQWLTISGWCVQGLLEQRCFILSYCSRSKVITAVQGRGPKRADVPAPCVVTHGTTLKVWVLCGLVLLRLVLSLHLLPVSVPPPFASSPPLLLSLQLCRILCCFFFPRLAFLTAAKLCWFPRVSPALIVCFCPSSTFISFGSSSPFFHYFKLVRDVVSLDFGFMVLCFFPPPPHCRFFTTIKINHFGSFL